MSIRTLLGRLSPRRLVVIGLVLLAVGGFTAFRGGDTIKVTAYFTETKGIYVGDDVTLLSVPIGKITSITAQPGQVKVEMSIDSADALPADAKAAIIGRSLVSVRSIALGPTYAGGARLASGDTIPISRTSTPVEWDEVKSELVSLANALGPDGAGKRGAAARLVHSAAGYLRGRGQTISQTIGDMATAFQTLDENRGNLFATVRNLQVFVTALNQSDAQVRGFNLQLAKVSRLLAGDSKNLASAVAGMRAAFTSAKSFLTENAGLTAATAKSIDETMSLLAEKRTYLADVLQDAPTAISNFYDIIDPRIQGPTGELAPDNLQSISGVVCGALTALDPEGGDTACRSALSPLLDQLHLDSLPVGVDPLQANTSSVGAGTTTPDQADILHAGGHR